jgi:hypothetical protein
LLLEPRRSSRFAVPTPPLEQGDFGVMFRDTVGRQRRSVPDACHAADNSETAASNPKVKDSSHPDLKAFLGKAGGIGETEK